jgi:hypothetical protein
MRIVLNTKTGMQMFDNVEMIIVDDIEFIIWQPNIGNKKGSRRTRFTRYDMVGVVQVYIDEKEK